jgi:fumarylpyruvate hydrolase
MSFVFPPLAQAEVPVRGRDQSFPVHRIYCVGRNFADHAKEMGATVDRGTPIIFLKPADAVVLSPHLVDYPPGTNDLHHEVELVVAIGKDANGIIAHESAQHYIFGYALGIDLTKRDLQAIAKEKRLPWDISKGFDQSAPISEIIERSQADDLLNQEISLRVNDELRQRAPLTDMIFSVDDIIHYLSGLFTLRAGDLIFMGTPSGVAALQKGDEFEAHIGETLSLQGHIA